MIIIYRFIKILM